MNGYYPPLNLQGLNLGQPGQPPGTPQAQVAPMGPPPGPIPAPAPPTPQQQSEPGFWAKLGSALHNVGPGVMQNPTPEQIGQAQQQGVAAYHGHAAGQAPPGGQAGPAAPVESENPWTKGKASEGRGAAAMQSQTIPAHEGRAVAPEAENLSNRAFEEKRAAAQAGSQAEQGYNEAQGAALAGQAEATGRINEEGQRREAKRSAAWDAQQAHVDRLRQEAASGSIVADRRHPLMKFTDTIASALGAFGAALSHTPNFALEAINKKINDDLEVQRDALARKGEKAKGAAEDLKMMRERFGDERAADNGFKALELEKAKLSGQSMVQSAQSPMLKAKWQAVEADITAEQAKLYAQAHPWVQGQTTAGSAAAEGVTDIKPDEVFTLNDGRKVNIPDTGAREKATEFTNKADQVKQAGDDIKQLLKMPFAQRAASPLEWDRRFKADKEQMAMAELMGGGKGGVGATRMNMEALGSGNFLWHPGVDKAVDIVVQNAQRARDAHIAHSAAYEVEPVQHLNPKTGITEQRHRIIKRFEDKPIQTGPQIKPAGT